jgi:ubiquitin carboxyl-terminal hydrolase 8
MREKQILYESYQEKKKSMPAESLIIEAFQQMKKYYGSSYSKITEIFTGFYHSSIKCPSSNCGYSCDKFDAYFQIGFEMPPHLTNPTLTDCMNKFCEEEILDADNLWKCDQCKQLVPAHKQLLLWTSPVVLVIQLKRFAFDRRRKDNRPVDYPLTNLDISSMVSAPNRDSRNKCYRYDLYSVINHVGGIHGGHYYSYCLDEESGRWYKYDDRTVTEIPINHIVNNNAYILFYLRRDMLQHI